MTTPSWERLKDVLHQVMQLEPNQQARFLDDACSDDPSFRAEINSLLSAGHDVPGSFMEVSPSADGFRASTDHLSTALQPEQIFDERFRLIRKLGEGGMGQVWLAEQLTPVHRQVALKLIKAGIYDPNILHRFRTEQQSLAIMEHGAIAKVFDAGTSPQGAPYFVMEYVQGLPITEYCDQKKLRIADRLELFIRACEGVQHAHQKAIIHRDLKPANILVVEVDGAPMPRIIDFGLAKATAPSADGESLFTHLGHLVGTPGYMSPEQADPGMQGIDTRTDVYSLGVVLYVLLAGIQPFELRRGERQPLDQWLRKLREEDPPTPSSKVGLDRDMASSAAQARGLEPKQLVQLLRRDLDWIAMKALEKDRNNRYGTPSELAADIRRYLNHEPVVACPASAGYSLRKYVRRHRVAVIVGASLLTLLVIFLAVQQAELRRITRERDRANRERDRANRISDFMAEMFKVPDPNEARGNTVTAREILDKASSDTNTALAGDPDVQAQMMHLMARTYSNLGLQPRAHDLAQRALDVRLGQLGAENSSTLESMSLLGLILDRQGKFTDAEKVERQTLDAEQRVLGREDPLLLETMDHLAVIAEHQGHYGEAEKLERDVIDAADRKMGPESLQSLRAMNNLGTVLWNEARYAEAEKVYRRLLDTERHLWGAQHPETLNVIGNLALVVQSQGHFSEAEPLYREAVSGQRRVSGLRNPLTADAIGNLASLLVTVGRLSEGEALTREALEIRLEALGPTHADVFLSKLNLADVLYREGHFQAAEKLQREILTEQMRLPQKGPETALAQSDLARTLNREGRHSEAESFARAAYDEQSHDLGPLHPDTVNSLQQLGIALARSGHYPEAGKLFRGAIDKGSTAAQDKNFLVWYSFACVAAAANRSDDAFEFLHEAVLQGYTDVDGLLADEDLKNLRGKPQFMQLVEEFKRGALKHPNLSLNK